MGLHANIQFSMDTFCFDKLILRANIKYSSFGNIIDQGGFLGGYERESETRSCRPRIHLQTRNGGPSDRSLQDHCETDSCNRGES